MIIYHDTITSFSFWWLCLYDSDFINDRTVLAVSKSCCSILFDWRHIVHGFNDLSKIYAICFCLQHATLSFSFFLPPSLFFILSVVCFVIPFSLLQSPFAKKFLSLSVLIMLAPRQHQSTFLSFCPHNFFFHVDNLFIFAFVFI